MGAATYIGRVGGLAVALGVGTAIATGHGVATADDTNNSTAPNTSTDGATSTNSTSTNPTTGPDDRTDDRCLDDPVDGAIEHHPDTAAADHIDADDDIKHNVHNRRGRRSGQRPDQYRDIQHHRYDGTDSRGGTNRGAIADLDTHRDRCPAAHADNRARRAHEIPGRSRSLDSPVRFEVEQRERRIPVGGEAERQSIRSPQLSRSRIPPPTSNSPTKLRCSPMLAPWPRPGRRTSRR